MEVRKGVRVGCQRGFKGWRREEVGVLNGVGDRVLLTGRRKGGWLVVD